MKKETITIAVKCKIEYETPEGRNSAVGALLDMCKISGFGLGSNGMYEYRMTGAREAGRKIKSPKPLQNPD